MTANRKQLQNKLAETFTGIRQKKKKKKIMAQSIKQHLIDNDSYGNYRKCV